MWYIFTFSSWTRFLWMGREFFVCREFLIWFKKSLSSCFVLGIICTCYIWNTLCTKCTLGLQFLYIKAHYLFLILYKIQSVYVWVNKPIWLSEMWLTFPSTLEILGFDLLDISGIVPSKLKMKLVTTCYACSTNRLCSINRFSITNVVIFT